MAFRKITEGDMLGKGNVGRPDTPGVSTAEMQPPTSAPRRPRG